MSEITKIIDEIETKKKKKKRKKEKRNKKTEKNKGLTQAKVKMWDINNFAVPLT